MSTTYTFDVFSTLDGFGAHHGDWGGYWGKQGPELLEHRRALLSTPQRMVFGATTYQAHARMLAENAGPELSDAWVQRMHGLPATVVSNSLRDPLDWPNAVVAQGDPVEVVERLKAESALPLRSHGSLTLNRSLLAAGLVDVVQVTVFPVVCGETGVDRIFEGSVDLDLELVEQHTFDAGTVELTYRPRRHVSA